MTQKTLIKLIYPAGRLTQEPTTLATNLSWLNTKGYEVEEIRPEFNSAWPYVAGSREERTKTLLKALQSPKAPIIWCAKGGYGCSDLLPMISWSKLGKKPLNKVVVGFSDCSALLSAVFVKNLGIKAIHGPMPGSELFGLGNYRDASAVLDLIEDCGSPQTWQLKPIGEPRLRAMRGYAFGGCLSVLTALIGTPFFPKSLKGAVLIFEDVGESPPKVIRMLNQWEQSGSFGGVKALIFGSFTEKAGVDCPSLGDSIAKEWARRSRLPLFRLDAVGHGTKNWPFLLGQELLIKANLLHWSGAD